MNIVKQSSEWQNIRKKLNIEDSIGFVPTMGNLHAGHASLLKRSRKENAISVLSIYVNPTQFNDPNDLKNYPRSLEQDLVLAQDCQVDYVLLFNDEDLYHDHFNYQIITSHPLSQIMEGIARPNHFTGVLTIVMKLLMLTLPHKAYFGEKDYQQLKLIEGLVSAFFLNIKIVACPTIREDSGLALSSRNNLLSLSDKRQAALLFQVLQQPLDLDDMKRQLVEYGFMIDYLELYENRLFAAVKIGNVRLIDNVIKN